MFEILFISIFVVKLYIFKGFNKGYCLVLGISGNDVMLIMCTAVGIKLQNVLSFFVIHPHAKVII